MTPKPDSDAAAGRKPAAARAETQPGPRTVTYEGIELTLPDQFPAEFLFDLIETEASNAEGEGNNQYLINLRLLRSLIGSDQFATVRHRFGRDPDQVMSLLTAVLGEFGLSMGESDASPDS